MIKRSLCLFMVLNLSSFLYQCSLFKQKLETEIKIDQKLKKDPGEISLELLKELQTNEQTIRILTDLSSDDMGGRLPGTEGMERATVYVEKFLKLNKLKPFFGESYRDSFKIGHSQAYNIVCLAEEYNKEEGFIIIGAHLDHLGKKPNYSKNREGSLFGSFQTMADTVYNGANDNISGVTAVLQIAKVFRQYDFNKNVMFVLFSGEEKDLAGSWHLSRRLKEMDVNIEYMLNFEMLGTILTQGENMTYITGYDLSNLAEVMNTNVGRKLVTSINYSKRYNLFERSDNFPFFSIFNIPAHSFSTFDFVNYYYYHHVGDEVDKLDIENISVLINNLSLSISRMINEGAVVKLH